MPKTIKMYITFEVEYEPEVDYYPEDGTIEEMAAFDAHNAEDDPIGFLSCGDGYKTTVKYEVGGIV